MEKGGKGVGKVVKGDKGGGWGRGKQTWQMELLFSSFKNEDL